jgi:glycogen operon protein
MEIQIKRYPGIPLPLGVNRTGQGDNFAIFSQNAGGITLLLYPDSIEDPPIRVEFDPLTNRTGNIWHIRVSGLPNRFLYTYHVDGPYDLKSGFIFDGSRALIDPYTRIIAGLERWGSGDVERREIAAGFEDTAYDWNGDRPLNLPFSDTIIYELHVRGFTRHHSSNVNHPGTFLGLVEKIEYLKQLGITAVELLPVHEFDENDCSYVNPNSGEKLRNYWGYSSINFFTVKASYASKNAFGEAINEFRDMVKAFHQAGIEVILDVVFNHTAEKDRNGWVINFKGLENGVYYTLDESGDYRNYSGCGNTLNCNHPVVREMILDSLRFWVIEAHVDGFRFDLASILSRDEMGNVLQKPPLIDAIAKDAVLAKTKIIAEAWDAAGLYQVGSFSASGRWAEWNDKYRDLVRRFSAGEPGLIAELATRLSGSEDLYKQSGRAPYHSINYVTAHDGFCMMDLVSYHRKHNLENGEENRDGKDDNLSMNFGVEGATTVVTVNKKRQQQIRNMATILMLSQGTPMILAGDEFGRTQKGNNNAWCQDNEVSWINWDLLDDNHQLFLFWRKLIHFRKSNPALRRNVFFTGEINETSTIKDITWFDKNASQADFNSQSRLLAFLIDGMEGDRIVGPSIYSAFNFEEYTVDFVLPTLSSPKRWQVLLSTSTPDDFINDQVQYLPTNQTSVQVAPFSITVLTRDY